MRNRVRVFVSFVVLLGIFFTASSMAKELSVLERVNIVEDRELGELIRIALENLPETKALKRLDTRSGDYGKLKFEHENAEEKARAQVVRSVAEAYSQIKLLDTQIEQAKKKMGRLTKNDAIFTELTLAIAELENKQSKQLAQIRQIMNIVPNYAFSHKPAKTLNGWLEFYVIGKEIFAFECSKPFREEESISSYPRYKRSYSLDTKLLKRMSKEEAVEYVDNYIKDKNNHPFRVDVKKSYESQKLSQELYDDIVSTVKTNKVELQSSVYLYRETQHNHDKTVTLSDGKMYERRNGSSQKYPDGEDKYTDSLVWLLDKPEFVPLNMKFEIAGNSAAPDQKSEALAERLSKSFLSKAKEKGMENVVNTETVLCFSLYGSPINNKAYSIYMSSGDYQKRENPLSPESFVNDVLSKHLQKAKKYKLRYRIVSYIGNAEVRQKIFVAIIDAVKEAGLEDRVVVQR